MTIEKTPRKCTACNGTGKGHLLWGGWTKCASCDGTGKKRTNG